MHQISKDAALKIDAATAEVHWTYGMIMDPYGADTRCPRQGKRAWVSFDDLPDDVRAALWKKMIEGP
jgi:hypothetical protein